MWVLPFLLSAWLLSGCQSMGANFSNAISKSLDWITGGDENADLPRPLMPIEEEVKILTLWDKDIGAGDGGHPLALTVASETDRVYTADYKGNVVALNLHTGERIWQVDTDLPLSAGPAIGSDTILLGTPEAEVIALDKDSGLIRWKTKLSSEVLAPSAAAYGIVVVHTGDEAVFALSEDDGKVLWSFGQRVAPLSLRGSGAPRILPSELDTESLALVGFANGRMALFRLSDGKLIWEKQLANTSGVSELEQVVDIDSTPAVQHRMFYVTAFYGGVIAASMLDGERIWHRSILAKGDPQVTWRHVFVTDVNSDVWSLDADTGRAYWKQTDLHQRQLTQPVPYEDWLAVGDYQGYVHLLSQEDGRLVGRKRISRSSIRTDPVVVGDILLVLSSAGELSALKVEK